MRALLLLTVTLAILATTACDSPIDVPANRIKSVSAIEDDPKFCAMAHRVFTCPGTDDVLVFVAFKHQDAGALESEGNNSLHLFHEHANVLVTSEETSYPVLMVCPEDPDGTVVFPLTYYAVLQFPDNTSPQDRLDTELRVVANGTYATTVDIQSDPSTQKYGEGIFPHDFGTVSLGETGVFHIGYCQHCPGAWILESLQLNDPAGVFEQNFPELPQRIEAAADFKAQVLFRPQASNEYRASLTLNYRTESGTRFQSVYEFSGSGE